MTGIDPGAADATSATQGGPGRLRQNAIGLADAIIVGMASSGPTASLAVTLAAIVAVCSYAGPLAIGVVLQIVAPGEVNSSLAAAISASVWLVIVTVIAYIGIQLTARFQWLLAAIEYLIVTVFAVVTLVAVLGHHRGTAPFHPSWFSWHSVGGTSGLVGGVLIAVYMFSGWDTSVGATQTALVAGSRIAFAVDSVGLMFALFYAATGIAMAVYYRNLAVRSVGAFTELAVVPLASAAFLVWVAVKSVPGLGGWNGSVLHYLYVMIGLGVVFLLAARFIGRSAYFAGPIEAYRP